MRSTPARAIWPTVRMAASMRTGGINEIMYDENARNVPIPIEPRMTSHPPIPRPTT